MCSNFQPQFFYQLFAHLEALGEPVEYIDHYSIDTDTHGYSPTGQDEPDGNASPGLRYASPWAIITFSLQARRREIIHFYPPI
jgi:hypothetical protein